MVQKMDKMVVRLALKAAIEQRKLSIFELRRVQINRRLIYCLTATVTGAGMWYSKLNFTTNAKGQAVRDCTILTVDV